MWFILIGLLLVVSPAQAQQVNFYEPYSCRLYADELRKCDFASCDQRVIERLKRECLLGDGGTISWPPTAH
jgi:hypothetical protein